MDDFLVFHCDGDDQWKLKYFAIALRCDVSIIQALFCTTMAWAAWSREQEEAEDYLLQLCKTKIEIFHRTHLQWNKRKIRFEGADDEGYRIRLSPGEETGFALCVCSVEYGSRRTLSIDVNENEEDKVYLTVCTGYVTTTASIRPGNFESVLDAQLKLLFEE